MDPTRVSLQDMIKAAQGERKVIPDEEDKIEPMYEDESSADEKMDSPDSDADSISKESESSSERESLSDINFVVSDVESVFVD